MRYELITELNNILDGKSTPQEKIKFRKRLKETLARIEISKMNSNNNKY